MPVLSAKDWSVWCHFESRGQVMSTLKGAGEGEVGVLGSVVVVVVGDGVLNAKGMPFLLVAFCKVSGSWGSLVVILV